MRLSSLRTPPPLRDADYAAIRARVMAEIARREERRAWLPLFRFAAAMAIVAVIVAGTLLSRKEQPRTVEVVARPRVAASRPYISQPAEQPQRPSRPRPKLVHRAAEPEMRIQIHTADPDIRIIWIVNPKLPREES